MRAKKNFQTLECYTGLKKLKVPAGSCVLLESMSNWLANEMYQEQGAKERTVEAVMKDPFFVGTGRELVVVTNEIFSDGIEYSPETVQYQAFSGQINQEIAKMAGNVKKWFTGSPVSQKREKRRTEIMKPWWNSFKIAFHVF